MNGLMMDSQLTITTIMKHADRIHRNSEIVSVTGDNPNHRYTYKDAFQRVRQLANALQGCGFKRGVGATLAWNDYRHFELYYAISCSGQICHTINPRLFAEQINFIINHAEDQWVFTDPMFVLLLESLKDSLPTVRGYVVLTDEAICPQASWKMCTVTKHLLPASRILSIGLIWMKIRPVRCATPLAPRAIPKEWCTVIAVQSYILSSALYRML